MIAAFLGGHARPDKHHDIANAAVTEKRRNFIASKGIAGGTAAHRPARTATFAEAVRRVRPPTRRFGPDKVRPCTGSVRCVSRQVLAFYLVPYSLPSS